MIVDSTPGIEITTRGFEPMSLQLTKDDVGKTYACRDGRIATIIEYNGHDVYPVFVRYGEGHDYKSCVTPSGRVWRQHESVADLLCELPRFEAGPDKPVVGVRLTREDDGKEYICRNGQLVTVKWENRIINFPFMVCHEGNFKCTVDKNGFQSTTHAPGYEWDVIRLATDAERIAAAPERSPVRVEKIPTPAEIDESKTRLGKDDVGKKDAERIVAAIRKEAERLDLPELPSLVTTVKESNPKDAVGVRKVPFSTLPWPVIAEADDANCSTGFVVKDSGERQQFASGMQRDTAAGKLRPDLIKDGPMYLRWVNHLTKGAIKYAPCNWMKAAGQEEYERFLESTDRHYLTWFMWRKYGINIEDPDNPTREPLKEDHAAAVFFNINGTEFTADQLAERARQEGSEEGRAA